MRSALLAALLLAAGCGTGTDGKPVAPTTPAPAPVPAPPPTVEAEVWLYAGSPDGYYVGDTIRVVVEFEQTTTVEGSPRLAIEIGDRVRLADFSPWVEDDWPPERPSFLQRFVYEVRADDEDADGISIAADALDFSEGAFLNAAGVEIEVEITAVAPVRRSPNPVEPGTALDTHRVLGQPEPRVCTDERELALAFHGGALPIREWDGTPIRVDMIRNFPGLTETDVADLLEAADHLARKIERQLGYRILEMGEVIPLPEGMQPGWNTNAPRHRRTCPLPREPGQILGFYMDGTHDNASHPSNAQANLSCGDFCFLRPSLRHLQTGANVDGVTLHEIFHLLGFDHDPRLDPTTLDRVGGVIMSYTLTRAVGPDADVVQWNDIDLLRCIFPEGG